MSFNYNPVQPVVTGSTVASAPVNLGFSQIAGAFNSHTTGALYGHSVTSGAGGITVGAAVQGTTAASTGATDLWTMLDRIANAVGVLATGTSSSGAWTSLGNIAGAASGVNNATALATANALVRRDGSGGAAFGPLTGTNIIGTATDSAHAGVYVRGASGDPSQYIFVVQNNAGSVNNLTVDNTGGLITRGRVTSLADLIVTTVMYAGSAVTQVTDSVGKINQAALPIVNSAHGGMGVDLTVGGNLPTARTLLGAAASGSNSDITALTGLTTAIGAAYGGTGLVSPAAGSIPVTNGAGNWQLLPPTPANYFVVSNGTTYVAQAFTTGMIPSGSLLQGVMSALYPSAGTGSGNLLKAQAQPWAGYINGTWVSFAGGTGNYSPAIDPTGITLGQSRIDLLVLNAAGNLAWSVGTPSATPSIAATVLPTNAVPIWYVKVYNGATSITGYTDTGSQAAFIQDARNLFGPTSATSGGSGAPASLTGGASYATFGNAVAQLPTSINIAAKPFVTVGADADLTNEQDISGLFTASQVSTINGVDLSLPRIGLNKIASATGQATLDDFMNTAVSGNVIGSLTVSGGTVSMKVPAGQPPIYVRSGTKEQRCDSAEAIIASNTVTLSGLYILVADLNGAGNHFTIALVASVGTLQVALQKFYYDSGANVLYNLPPHGPYEYNKPHLSSANVTDLQQAAFYATTAALPAAGSVTQLPGSTAVTFNLPDQNMVAFIEIYGHIQSTATPGDFRVYGMSSSGSGTPLGFLTTCYAQFSVPTASATFPFFAKTRITGFGPGPVNFGIGYYAVPANYVIVLPTLFVRFVSSVQSR